MESNRLPQEHLTDEACVNWFENIEKTQLAERVFIEGLIEGFKNAKSGAFSVKDEVLSLTVTLNSCKLRKEDSLLIKQLFGYFLEDRKMAQFLTVRIGDPRFGDAWYSQIDVVSFNRKTASSGELINHSIIPLIIHSAELFAGLLSSLNENGFPIEISEWCGVFNQEITYLFERIKKNHNYGVSGRECIYHLVDNVDYLYRFSKDSSVLIKSLPALVMLLIVSDKDDILFSFLGKKDYVDVITKTNGERYFYLYEALEWDNLSFQILLELLNKLSYSYDSKGNSFLHLCKKNRNLKQALEFTSTIDDRNLVGNTALHTAALEGNLEKAHFLLSAGADSTIKNDKGETFWNMAPENELWYHDVKAKEYALHVYRLYKQYGNVLKSPPVIVKQEGPNCGFYAVACAANHHRSWHPQLFKRDAIPARKRDVNPKEWLSLLQLRKELGILGIGPIFSAKELEKVIEKTECKSLVADINDYQQFMDFIKKAIEQNLPIIIPFAVSNDVNSLSDKRGEPDPLAPSTAAHWATVIGWIGSDETESILLAQWEKYYNVQADDLFKSFYDIGSTFPESYMSKKKGEQWKTDKEKPNDADKQEDIKYEIIPLTDLQDFRRKLVIVLPPQYDVELLNLNSNKISLSNK